MHIAKDAIDVVMAVSGATLRLTRGFGEAAGTLSAECFTLAAGVDTTPLFVGLPGDLCQCPHWGYVIRGSLTTTDRAGTRETVRAGDLFHWPPGHNVKVDEDAEIVMFSPQDEHCHVIGHMRAKVGA